MFVYFTLNSFLTIRKIEVDENSSITDFRDTINYHGPMRTETMWILFDHYTFAEYEIPDNTYFFGYSLSKAARFITTIGKSLMTVKGNPRVNNYFAQTDALNIWTRIQSKFRGDCEICDEPCFILTNCGCLICTGCARINCPICKTTIIPDLDSQLESLRIS